MLTVSILWVALAAVVTVAAMMKRSRGTSQEKQAREPGNALAFVAVLYSLALLAGFVYVSKFFVSGL